MRILAFWCMCLALAAAEVEDASTRPNQWIQSPEPEPIAKEHGVQTGSEHDRFAMLA